MKKRYTEEQIIGFLREADAGVPIVELCRRHGFSEASFYLWRNKFGGMSVSDAKRLKELRSGPEKSGAWISDISASMGDGSRRPTGAESNEKTPP